MVEWGPACRTGSNQAARRASRGKGSEALSRRGWVLFLAMGLIWGIPYLLIKIAVEEFAPTTIVLGRTAIAAAILLPIAALRGHLRALLPHWRPVLAFAVIEICIPWVLLGYAEQSLSSSLT